MHRNKYKCTVGIFTSYCFIWTLCTTPTQLVSVLFIAVLRVVARVNKRGECLTLYSPVIDDCEEVKRLLFRVTYRLLVFVHFITAISLAAP